MASGDENTLTADTLDGLRDTLASDEPDTISIGDGAIFGDSEGNRIVNANGSGSGTGKRRGRPRGSKNRSSFEFSDSEGIVPPSPEISAGVENDIAFALSKFTSQAAKMWGEHWQFDRTEARLITKQAARTFQQVPGIPTRFGLIANVAILAGMGALLIGPRVYITKLLIQQQRMMMQAQMQQQRAQAGVQPSVNGSVPDMGADPVQEFLR